MTSKLEEALWGQIRMLSMEEDSTFPMPVRELHFDWCCEHEERRHMRRGVEEFCADCSQIPQCFHTFRRGRKWRFDFAWPALMVAAECEGGIHTGGRHVRGSGFEKDAEKYTEAALQGWRVLRFTRRQITSGEALRQIERALSSARSQVDEVAS